MFCTSLKIFYYNTYIRGAADEKNNHGCASDLHFRAGGLACSKFTFPEFWESDKAAVSKGVQPWQVLRCTDENRSSRPI